MSLMARSAARWSGTWPLSALGRFRGASLLYWVYQGLAVVLLAVASMTAFQDAQATEWRDVAIGEIPEAIIYRDKRGTFTRSVTITFGLAVIIMLLVKGRTDVAAPFYGVGVFMPITIMGLAMRQHILQNCKRLGAPLGRVCGLICSHPGASVWVFQIIGKWEEGGWVRLISFTVLFTSAHLVILSPLGYRDPKQIHRIVREKARIRGAMASIVEWQSLKMQEYRYSLLVAIARFWQFFGINRPVRYDPPVVAGDYNEALHVDHPDAPSLLEQYLDNNPSAPKLGGAPKQTAPGDEEGKDE